MENPICKFYQTGFCKFRQNCQKKHDIDICKNIEDCNDIECIKRHPKTCKNFKENGKCRFNSECAYLHKEDPNSQSRLNEIISHCMIKHEQEISDLKEEVNKLKEVVNIMTEKSRLVRRH